MTTSSIPCEGYWTDNSNGRDFGCGYCASFICEDCICTGGELDPRTDEKFDLHYDQIIEHHFDLQKEITNQLNSKFQKENI